MRYLILLSILATLLLSNSDCKKKESAKKYKGRLEIKALCMNYTISVLEGEVDSSMVAESWTDETTNKTYHNAFKLGSPCTFPQSIKEKDEFYFVLDTAAQECMVCLAYYPTPTKALNIKVVE